MSQLGVPAEHSPKPKRGSAASPAIRAQSKLIKLGLLISRVLLHWEGVIQVSQADRIPLVPSSRCLAGSPSSLCCSGLGNLARG